MSLFNRIHRLPLPLLGLENLPAVPIVLEQWLGTLLKLDDRAQQIKPAVAGLDNTYTVQGQTAEAIDFLFGPSGSGANPGQQSRHALITALQTNLASSLSALFTEATREAPAEQLAATEPLTTLSLDDPAQFAMGWTTYAGVYQAAEPHLAPWAATLTDAQAATEQFWPIIAQYGLGFNLLLAQKVTSSLEVATQFGPAVTLPIDLAQLAAAGLLYAIDLSLFTSLEPQVVAGGTRFTPATYTLLVQDPATKALTPVAIWVAGYAGDGKQVYVHKSADTTDSAWLYALQAVKVSVTVYGIWLGHVYHWHLVTAAMQMTLFNTLDSTHPVYQLLAPRSEYLMAFDNVLILLWRDIAPPTSLSTAWQFLKLANDYAADRSFLNDDPLATLARLGVQASDFTVHTAWDQYPIVGQLLTIWQAVADYVQVFVTTTYATDERVGQDQALQAWLAQSGSTGEGNVAGLPAVQTRADLAAVLTSLVYRITVHGTARLLPMTNPGLAFVANFPPCLCSATIPAATTELSTAQLLEYLPTTGIIGAMLTFYFTFCFSVPYEPLISAGGPASNPPFTGAGCEPLNAANTAFLNQIAQFITSYYAPSAPQLQQWPLNIET